MNYYIDPASAELFAYDDEQIAAGIVREGLQPCPPRPDPSAVWQNGAWAVPAPTADQQVAANIAAVQSEMDRQAKAKGYDNILSACSYAAQPPGAAFQAEGAAFLQWRSDVWQQAYATLADVQAGKVPMPTPAEAVAQMPALVLP